MTFVCFVRTALLYLFRIKLKYYKFKSIENSSFSVSLVIFQTIANFRL